jgi:micrococcal nuclease
MKKIWTEPWQPLKAQKLALSSPRRRGPLPETKLWYYQAVVQKVVDGDTIDFIVDLGFNVRVDARVRVRGINTAELKKENEKVAADAAKLRVQELLPPGTVCVIKTTKDKVEKYGRMLADVTVPKPVLRDLREMLIEEGLAVNYDGGKK